MAKYDAINFTPPQGVRAACRRGLKLHEQGLSGDGLEPATVAWARKFAAGDACSPAKARKGNRWYGRNNRFAKQPKDSPAYVSWLLWGGRAGKGWFASLVRQMDAADKRTKSIPCRPSLEAITAEYAQKSAHEFSTVQVNLYGTVGKQMQDFTGAIPESELAPYGREAEPHVTVKYGLHTNNAKDVLDVVREVAPFTITLGAVDCFETEEYDVVYVSVESDALRNLNQLLSDSLEHMTTYPTYTPHATLAYVKSGIGQKYRGQSFIDPSQYPVQFLTFSSQDNIRELLPLADTQKDASAMHLERKFVDLASFDFDAKAAGNGDLKGYASVTGEIDEGGDIIPTGGYSETLDDFLRTGWMAHSHDWSVAGQVGYPVEAREDDTGLYVRAEFHGTPDAQAVRTKAAERMRAGKQVGLSIGYRPSAVPEYIYPDKYATELVKYIKPARLAENLKKAQQFSRVRILPKVELREFSIVTAPMNRLSEATAIKSEGTMKPTAALATVETPDESTEAKGYFESALVERMTGEGLWPLQSALAEAIHEIQDDCEEGECADPAQALRDTLQAFAERVYAMMLPLFRAIQPEAPDTGVTLAGFTNLSKLLALKSEPLAGLPFSAHSETALAAVGEIATEVTALKDCLAAYSERGKSIQEMRVKVGRAISAARLEQMGATCGRIKTLMGDLQSIHDDLTALMDGAKPMTDAEQPKAEEKADTPEAPTAELSAEAAQLYAQILKHRLTQLTAVK